MYELIKWFDEIRKELPMMELTALEDAKTQKTFGKAKKYVNQNKVDLSNSFHATAADQVDVLFNAVLEDVIQDIQHEFNNTEIPHDDRN